MTLLVSQLVKQGGGICIDMDWVYEGSICCESTQFYFMNNCRVMNLNFWHYINFILLSYPLNVYHLEWGEQNNLSLNNDIKFVLPFYKSYNGYRCK